MPESIPFQSLAPFASLKDPRRDHPTKLHPLFEILSLTLLASLSGAENWAEIELWSEANQDWLQQFFPLENGIPSHDTFSRVFALLDPEPLAAAFLAWSSQISTHIQGVVAFDGKTVRRSLDRPDGKGPIHVVSAFAVDNRVVLAQLKVDDKTNEITALPQLIRLLDLSGCTATIDAMGCQVECAQAIRDQKGDYMLCIKENQPTLYTEVKELFDHALKPNLPKDQSIAYVESVDVDKGHGRIEQRRCIGIEDLQGLSSILRWPGAKSVWMIESKREVLGVGESVEKRYYLGSLVARVAEDARRGNETVRSHWGIENSVHWVLDMALGEDWNRARVGHSAENLSLVRKIVLNIVKQDKKLKVGVKARLKRAGWDKSYLLHLLTLC